MAIDTKLDDYLTKNRSAAAQYAASWIGSTATAPYTWIAEPAKGFINGTTSAFGMGNLAQPLFDQTDSLAAKASGAVSEIGLNAIGNDRLTQISETISNVIAPFVAKISEFLNTSRHQLGNAMLSATDAAGAVNLQQGLAANLEKALASDAQGELPPASVVAGSVAKGLRDATQSVGGLMKSVKADAANALGKLVGQEKNAATDAAVVAHETTAQIHGALFADSYAYKLGKLGDTPENRQTALAYADKAAYRITGLSVDEAKLTDPSKIQDVMKRGDGLGGFLAARTSEVASGKPISNAATITLAPDAPVAPAQTPTVTATRTEEKTRS